MTRHGWIRDSTVRIQLARVEDALTRAATRGRQPPAIHRQLLSARTKRLRPSLLLLAGRLGPADGARVLVRSAAGIEMLHEATLYHDDIVDEAGLRRGEVTLQHALGRRVAACAGSELLYATATQFAALPAVLRRRIGRAIEALCRGQLREVEAIGDLHVSVRTRVRVMRDKTARLFELAARLGAELAHADPVVVRTATRFGLHFGLSFQLADDLRDLLAGEQELGRPAGADLRDGVYSLPVILALHQGGPPGRRLRAQLIELQHVPTGALLRECLRTTAGSDGVRQAVALLDVWTAAAGRDLHALGNACPPDVHASLVELLRRLRSSVPAYDGIAPQALASMDAGRA